MYIFIFREGVVPRICIILAGVERGGEKVSLCPIFFPFPEMRWRQRFFFYSPFHTSVVVIPVEANREQTFHTGCQRCQSRLHTIQRAAPAAQRHQSHVFLRGKRTSLPLISSSQIFSTSLQEHDILYFPNSLACACIQSS